MAQPTSQIATVGSNADRPLKELLSELGENTSTLIRKEVELAKVELNAKVKKVTQGSVTIGAGSLLAYAGLIVLAASLTLLLIRAGVVAWLAALLVSALYVIVGWVMIQSGRRRLHADKPAMHRTKRSAEQTVQWAKEQLS